MMLPLDDSVMDDMVDHPNHSRGSLNSGLLLTAYIRSTSTLIGFPQAASEEWMRWANAVGSASSRMFSFKV
jgi:hypothetical protein